jgi:hypothetical protein
MPVKQAAKPVKQEDARTIKAFGFEFTRLPGVWEARRVCEQKEAEQIVETASVFVKGNGKGILLIASSWKRETGKTIGELQWNAFVHFRITDLTREAVLDEEKLPESTYDKSLWKKYDEDNREFLEAEMAKFMRDPKIQEDIAKLQDKLKKRTTHESKFERLSLPMYKALKSGKITEKEARMCIELKDALGTVAPANTGIVPVGSVGWEDCIERTAKILEKVFGIPQTIHNTKYCISAILGGEAADQIAEAVYKRLHLKPVLGTTTTEEV